MNIDSTHTRTYRQSARAKAAEETGNRIVDAFLGHLQSQWFDEIRLEDVAKEAGVTVQTVIRRFGSKEGLLRAASDRMQEEIVGKRAPAAQEVGRAVDTLIGEYETAGPLMMRLLSQEQRYPAIRTIADRGRTTHREWVGNVFARWLPGVPAENRERIHDRLVIALDLYVWKLLRVDMGRSLEDLRKAMLEMAASALEIDPGELERPAQLTEA
ncbi:TetR/AcrR family transcriptional regulator [Altererythrobacter sp. CC-YST694]|uniref:TetR/AcrR family transcriptional regulator n=1 Tax=Altererythrobacter sp. CC-YST694 TaxID=2755038 RepID=UPI001D00717F|nr:TetR/AcrR family transcriptional regulator [Altererythrobacter sp. CC-YST694]MCB5424050.1 TetR/AcrR family transcriptional regulator [Altererythrobacter sp. CC-YST694]